MTPEERWIKIENSIQALLGLQAQHEVEIAENRGQIAENHKQIAETTKQIARFGEQMERKISQIDAQIEKNTAAIRDLIVVSRTVIETQQATDKQIDRVKVQLELLIKTVDAFVKGFQKPNGNQ